MVSDDIKWNLNWIYVQSNIQERQETGSWRNCTELWPSDSRPDKAETYKYLGMEERESTPPQDEDKNQETIQVMDQAGAQLSIQCKEQIAAINTLAVTVVLYSYVVTDWKLDEIQDPDKMTRNQLCMN